LHVKPFEIKEDRGAKLTNFTNKKHLLFTLQIQAVNYIINKKEKNWANLSLNNKKSYQ